MDERATQLILDILKEKYPGEVTFADILARVEKRFSPGDIWINLDFLKRGSKVSCVERVSPTTSFLEGHYKLINT